MTDSMQKARELLKELRVDATFPAGDTAKLGKACATLRGEHNVRAIATALDEARREEREACAKIAKRLHEHPRWDHWHEKAEWYGAEVAEAIRSRSQE